MARKIEVQIVGDADSLSRAFGSASRSANSFGSSLGGKVSSGLKAVGRLAAGAGLALGAGFAATVAIGAKSLIAHEKANAQLNAVLKSTGNVANTTTAAISKQASALESLSGVDDVVVKQGAALLLTFKNIRNEVGAGNDIFNQATTALIDMSVALGKQPQDAAIMLGKALNDPIAGLTALTRAGVQFTDGQKAQIKAMVESGDVMGAQKIILAELTSQFGGSAEALGGTFAGKVEILRAKFEGMAETIAARVMPYASQFLDFLGSVLEADSAGEALSRFFGGLKSIGTDIFNAIKDAVSQIDWGGVWSTIVGFVSSLASKIAGLDWSAIGATVMRVVGAVLGAIPWADAVGGTIKLGAKLLSAVVASIKEINWSEVGQTLLGVVGAAISSAFGAGRELGAGIGYDIGYSLGKTIADGIGASLDLIVPVADALLGTVSTTLNALGNIPGAGKLKDWANTIDEARENMRGWKDSLDKATNSSVDFGEELNAGNAELKLAASFATSAARALTETEGSFSLASRGAGELVKSVGTLAGLSPPQIKALINDQEFLGKLATIVERIKAMPGSKEFKAQALVQAAQDLVEQFTGKVKAIPNSSKTDVSVPGAVDSTTKAGEVDRAVSAIPNSSRTSISVSGASTAVNAAQTVAAMIRGIPTSWTTYVNIVQQGGVALPGNARGTDFWRGGLTMVGEEGPELVSLPRGSAVYPASETRRMLAGAGASGAPGGGGSPVIVQFPNYVGERRELEAFIVSVLTRYKQRNGTELFA